MAGPISAWSSTIRRRRRMRTRSGRSSSRARPAPESVCSAGASPAEGGSQLIPEDVFRRPTLSDISQDGGTSYLEGNNDETAGSHGGARAWRDRGGPGPNTDGAAASHDRARAWRLRGRVRL